jgi:ABC-type transport system substrate-binding protein
MDEDLQALVLRCLAKDPRRRPQRASDVAEALYRWLSGSGTDEETPAAGTRAAPMPPPERLVGRARELDALLARLERARTAGAQLVLVSGEPGVGKTRLLEELDARARAARVRVLRGRFVDRDRAFPYQGLCEAIQDHFRRLDPPPPPAALEFSDLAAPLRALFPVLSEIAELRRASERPARAPRDPTEVFELLARTLLRMAGDRPLVLLLEDLHEAGVSVEALRYVLRRLGAAPVLVVGTYRTTEADRHHPLRRLLSDLAGDPRVEEVPLRPFTAPELRDLLQGLLAGPVAGPALDHVLEATEGNALFARELLRGLRESGGLAQDRDGLWALSGAAALAPARLPPTIQQTVLRRLDELPAELRKVADAAAVVGRTFGGVDVRPLVDVPDLDEALDRLIAGGIVQEEGGTRGRRLAFASGVLREVLYSSLSRKRRRALHRRHAEDLERRHAGRLERAHPQLVHHFSQADVADKTVEYGLLWARRSLDAFSAGDALRSAAVVLEFLDEEWSGEPGLRGEARLLLASAHRLAGDHPAALREAEQAVAAFEGGGDLGGRLAAVRLLVECAWQARLVPLAEKWVQEGISTARAARETGALWGLLSLAATMSNLRGEYQRGNEYLQEAEGLAARPGGDRRRRGVPRGGRLRVAMASPLAARELSNVFETLLAADAHGNLRASLCESWDALDGGRTFRFRLRAGVAFSDGHPLTAAAVRASVERAVREGAGLRAAFAAIEGVGPFREGSAPNISGLRELSEVGLEVRLREPLPIFPVLLVDPNTAVSRRTGGAEGSASVVGTGPFVCVSHAGDRMVLETRSGYWRARPPVDALEFQGGLGADGVAVAFRAGEADVARDLLPGDVDALLRDAALRPQLCETVRRSTWFALFNTRSTLGRREELRQALSALVRPHDLVWRTLGRLAVPAWGLLPPGMLGHDPGRRRRALAAEQARERLQAAGLLLPLTLRASVHPLLRVRYAALTAALGEAWGEIGVTLDDQAAGMEGFLEAAENCDAVDLRLCRWNADYDDPDNFTRGLFHSREGVLRAYFSSGVTDALLDEARAATQPDQREDLYRAFETELLDAAVVVPLFHEVDCRLVTAAVRGLRLRSSPPYANYSELGKSSPEEWSSSRDVVAGERSRG